jgi:hypothetical protein
MAIILAFFDTPLGKWILIAAVAIAAAIAFGTHERSVGYRLAMDQIDEQRRKEETEYLRIMGVRQAAYNALQAKFQALTAQHEVELKAAEQKRLDDLAALKKGIPDYVSAEATRSCPDVPRGYLMFRASAAAFANSTRASPAADAGAHAADAPSGVSLSTLADTDAGQAGAYRACVERQSGWLKYRDDVEAWAAEVSRILAIEH